MNRKRQSHSIFDQILQPQIFVSNHRWQDHSIPTWRRKMTKTAQDILIRFCKYIICNIGNLILCFNNIYVKYTRTYDE